MLCHASHYEAAGLAYVEAGAAGLPAIENERRRRAAKRERESFPAHDRRAPFWPHTYVLKRVTLETRAIRQSRPGSESS
jgi:hypothetical protein